MGVTLCFDLFLCHCFCVSTNLGDPWYSRYWRYWVESNSVQHAFNQCAFWELPKYKDSRCKNKVFRGWLVWSFVVPKMQRGVQRGWRVLWFYLLWFWRCRCSILFRRARFEFSVGSFGFWIKHCSFWIIYFGFLITPQLVSESVSCGFWSDASLVSESHCKAWCWGSMFFFMMDNSKISQQDSEHNMGSYHSCVLFPNMDAGWIKETWELPNRKTFRAATFFLVRI